MHPTSTWASLPLLLFLTMTGCHPDDQKKEAVIFAQDPYPSTYQRPAASPVLLQHAAIYFGNGGFIEQGFVLLQAGKIAYVGSRKPRLPAQTQVVEAKGRYVTPGLIDPHSHLGDYPSPEVEAHQDGNEMSDPNTAQVRAEHGIWPQDPGFRLAREGGVTTLAVLPGSANLFGGWTAVLKNVPARTVQGMKFPGAGAGMKMACGENPKRVYGRRKQLPMTRMGNMAGFREALVQAQGYVQRWQRWQQTTSHGGNEQPPERNLKLESLGRMLQGEMAAQVHCYRADEMAQMLDLAQEFGFRIAAFHHATEAYKVADLLARRDVCAVVWADWWGFKLESWDGIRENAALLQVQGACVALHSDDPHGIQRLNQEMTKAWAAGQRLGLAVTKAQALAWVTLHPARVLGIAQQTGSLEEGKMADVVLWSGDPFSVYSLVDQVYIDGALVHARTGAHAASDFELGTVVEMGAP